MLSLRGIAGSLHRPQGSRAVLGSRMIVGLLFLPLVLAACGDKLPEDEPVEKAEGIETSFTGSVYKTYDGNLQRSISAVKSAFQKLSLRMVDESGAIFKKSLEAESADGTNVSVSVTEVTKNSTRIGIKVGRLFGDEDAARRIHSEVEAELASGRQPGKAWGGFSSFGRKSGPSKAGTEGVE